MASVQKYVGYYTVPCPLWLNHYQLESFLADLMNNNFKLIVGLVSSSVFNYLLCLALLSIFVILLNLVITRFILFSKYDKPVHKFYYPINQPLQSGLSDFFVMLSILSIFVIVYICFFSLDLNINFLEFNVGMWSLALLLGFFAIINICMIINIKPVYKENLKFIEKLKIKFYLFKYIIRKPRYTILFTLIGFILPLTICYTRHFLYTNEIIVFNINSLIALSSFSLIVTLLSSGTCLYFLSNPKHIPYLQYLKNHMSVNIRTYLLVFLGSLMLLIRADLPYYLITIPFFSFVALENCTTIYVSIKNDIKAFMESGLVFMDGGNPGNLGGPRDFGGPRNFGGPSNSGSPGSPGNTWGFGNTGSFGNPVDPNNSSGPSNMGASSGSSDKNKGSILKGFNDVCSSPTGKEVCLDYFFKNTNSAIRRDSTGAPSVIKENGKWGVMRTGNYLTDNIDTGADLINIKDRIEQLKTSNDNSSSVQNELLSLEKDKKFLEKEKKRYDELLDSGIYSKDAKENFISKFYSTDRREFDKDDNPAETWDRWQNITGGRACTGIETGGIRRLGGFLIDCYNELYGVVKEPKYNYLNKEYNYKLCCILKEFKDAGVDVIDATMCSKPRRGIRQNHFSVLKDFCKKHSPESKVDRDITITNEFLNALYEGRDTDIKKINQELNPSLSNN